MTLGQRLEAARKAIPLTQSEVARNLGLKREAVSQWEGDKFRPDIDKLPLLAVLYKTTVDALLGVGHLSKPTDESVLFAIERLGVAIRQCCEDLAVSPTWLAPLMHKRPMKNIVATGINKGHRKAASRVSKNPRGKET